MDVWQWVLVYAAFLALVQLLIYYYLRRGRERQSVTVSAAGDPSRRNGAVPNRSGLQDAPVTPEDIEAATDPERDDAIGVDADEDALVCPHCGAHNEREPIYTYCRHCASPLGA